MLMAVREHAGVRGDVEETLEGGREEGEAARARPRVERLPVAAGETGTEMCRMESAVHASRFWGSRFVFTFGSRFAVRGSRFIVHGSRFAVRGSRFIVHGSRFTVHGSRFAVRGSRFTVRGSLFAVHCSRFAVRGSEP